VELLAVRERTAGELIEAGSVQCSTLSEHLRTLRVLGVIDYERRGTTFVYRLNRDGLTQTANWIRRIQQSRS
jgi:DNA-binding transcriptional ArsR family regulator